MHEFNIISITKEYNMKEILLENLLHILEKETNRPIKIKFNQHNGFSNPMDLYKDNPDEINNQWLFWRNKKRYFDVGDVAVCFLKLSSETWLLTTIKKVTKELNILYGINYEGEELKEYERSFEFQDIGDDVIDNLKTQILNHRTNLHCPMCGEPLVTRIAKMYDLEDNLVLQPKAHCVKCVFQIKE